MDMIKIEIHPEKNEISIYNNGLVRIFYKFHQKPKNITYKFHQRYRSNRSLFSSTRESRWKCTKARRCTCPR